MKGTLLAIDGLNGGALVAVGRKEVKGAPRGRRGGVSEWDASGIFGDLVVAGNEAGLPSPRTLLLLYAADLKFRLRWEILPAVAKGQLVIAAPYIDTATAFGRAAGLDSAWLDNLFLFAPRPDAWRRLTTGPSRDRKERDGFVEFACGHLADRPGSPGRKRLREKVLAELKRGDLRD